MRPGMPLGRKHFRRPAFNTDLIIFLCHTDRSSQQKTSVSNYQHSMLCFIS
jgi:hypothetical protein